MAITVVPTAYGTPAAQALRDAVARAKRVDALAPVTVIVPTNSVGVSARRRLASGALGSTNPSGRGVVGATFLTVYRLAELLGAAGLAAAGRRPVSTPVVASAVRRALARDPGLFAPVARHPATEEALVAVHRDLADLDATQLDVLAAQGRRAREVVRLHRSTTSLLAADWYDEHDLLQVATDLVAADHPIVRGFGTIVAYLPQRWSRPVAGLLRALAAGTGLEVIVGVTGSETADAQVVASLRRVGAEIPGDEAGGRAALAGDEVWSASDPDDEIRAVVRAVIDAMRVGVPLERIAVLYASDDPYARLLHEHFDLAGIAHNGATTRSMSESVLGRGLLRILALADTDFARDDVCGLFAAAPVLDGRGRPVPAAQWERLSRDAGVVRGVSEWDARLGRYAATLTPGDRADRVRAQVDALRTFVSKLSSELDPERLSNTWSGLARLAHQLVQRYFGGEARRTAWPPFEQVAARRVESVLDRLATLDTIDPGPTIDTFRRTFELELDAARDRVGRLGDGVLVGPVAMALGVDLDRLWVCGLAEGRFPSVPHDDPLLGDRERAALGGDLPLRADRTAADERHFLAALSSTAPGGVVCTYPRGDLRRSTEHVPSRFLAASAAANAVSRSIPSYAHGVTHVAFPANRHELGVRAAVAGASWVASQPGVAPGLALTRARAGHDFTRFDGNLAHLRGRLAAISPASADRVASPTRLQTWASCPHAYFVQTVLHVEPIERPEDIMALAPIERGSLVHEILDRFVDEVRGQPDAGRPWHAADHARLREIAEEACAAAEAKGVTGRRLLWHRDRRIILGELDAFLDADQRYRAEGSVETLATELPFGMPNGEGRAVEVPLDDGRIVRVRGQADRVDRRADGTLVVVDYKSGSEIPYRSLNHDDPVTAGTHLQLPVYAYAARTAYGTPTTNVEAYYWFVGRGKNQRVGYDVDAAVDTVFRRTLRTIVDGIEAGVFPLAPTEPAPSPFIGCRYCDPDGMGTTDRWRDWQRKVADPGLAVFRSLAEPAPAEPAAGIVLEPALFEPALFEPTLFEPEQA